MAAIRLSNNTWLEEAVWESLQMGVTPEQHSILQTLEQLWLSYYTQRYGQTIYYCCCLLCPCNIHDACALRIVQAQKERGAQVLIRSVGMAETTRWTRL